MRIGFMIAVMAAAALAVGVGGCAGANCRQAHGWSDDSSYPQGCGWYDDSSYQRNGGSYEDASIGDVQASSWHGPSSDQAKMRRSANHDHQCGHWWGWLAPGHRDCRSGCSSTCW